MRCSHIFNQKQRDIMYRHYTHTHHLVHYYYYTLHADTIALTLHTHTHNKTFFFFCNSTCMQRLVLQATSHNNLGLIFSRLLSYLRTSPSTYTTCSYIIYTYTTSCSYTHMQHS